MVKSIFTIDDYPVGSMLYWIYPTSAQEKAAMCFDKFKVVGTTLENLMIQNLESSQIENLNKAELEELKPLRFIIPEYIYNEIHQLPNTELNEKQKLQLLFLTGNTGLDLLVKEATKTYTDYWSQGMVTVFDEDSHD